MIENLIFAIILLFVNLILIYKPIPILAFPVEMVTLYIYATQFLADTTLPMQPFFTVFLVIVNVSGLLVNGFELRSE